MEVPWPLIENRFLREYEVFKLRRGLRQHINRVLRDHREWIVRHGYRASRLALNFVGCPRSSATHSRIGAHSQHFATKRHWQCDVHLVIHFGNSGQQTLPFYDGQVAFGVRARFNLAQSEQTQTQTQYANE